MKKLSRLMIAILVIVSMGTASFAESSSYKKEELIFDLEVFQKLLEDNHGNLYESISKEELDALFENAKKNISDDMTIQEFYFELCKVVHEIKDGHTSVFSSIPFIQHVLADSKYLPLKIKFIEGKMYCDIANQYIPVGSEIVSINGHTIPELMDKFKYVNSSESSDEIGYGYTILESSLLYYYPQFFEERSDHEISFKPPGGDSEITVSINTDEISPEKLLNFGYSNYLKDEYMHIAAPLDAEFDMQTKTALLRIHTFYPDNMDLFVGYVNTFFEDVKYNKIENIIFDVRGNPGGEEVLLNHILSYLYDEPFNSMKSINVRKFDIEGKNLLTQRGHEMFISFIKTYGAESEYEKLDDGSFYFQYDNIEPFDENRFSGNVYVIGGKESFSCASIFIQKVQELENGYFIGTESSGNYYEVTAGSIPIWELPNTKLRVAIPLLQMVLNDEIQDGIPRDSGARPDYEVELKYDDYLNGIDTQLEFVHQLIAQ